MRKPTSRTSASNAATGSWRSRKGNKPAAVPLVARTGPDLAIGERTEGPILQRHVGQRLDSWTAYRWVRSIGKRAGLDHVHPHMLRAAFIMAALDAGVPLRDVQIAARHSDPRIPPPCTTDGPRATTATRPTPSSCSSPAANTARRSSNMIGCVCPLTASEYPEADQPLSPARHVRECPIPPARRRLHAAP